MALLAWDFSLNNRTPEDRFEEFDQRLRGLSTALYALALAVTDSETAEIDHIRKYLSTVVEQMRTNGYAPGIVGEVSQLERALEAVQVLKQSRR